MNEQRETNRVALFRHGTRVFEDISAADELPLLLPEPRCARERISNWNAVNATNWRACKEGKQAEFLIEREFPWELISRIGVLSRTVNDQVLTAVQALAHKPVVEIKPEWYY